MEETWIVLIFFLFSTIQTLAIAYMIYHYKKSKLDTIIKLSEKTGEVNPEVFAALGSRSGPTSDLRKGLIWLAIGIPVFIGFMLTNISIAIFLGGVPILIGVAYLTVRKLGYTDGSN